MIEELKKMPIATQQGQCGVDRVAGIDWLAALIYSSKDAAVRHHMKHGEAVLHSLVLLVPRVVSIFRPVSLLYVGIPRNRLAAQQQ